MSSHRSAKNNRRLPGHGYQSELSYDFCSLKQVVSAGQREEDIEVLEPLAFPEFIKFFTEKAESWRRLLLAMVQDMGPGSLGV